MGFVCYDLRMTTNTVTITVVNRVNEAWDELLDIIKPCLDPRAYEADESTIDAVTETTGNNLEAKRDAIAALLDVDADRVTIDEDIIDSFELVWIVFVDDQEAAFIEYAIT